MGVDGEGVILIYLLWMCIRFVGTVWEIAESKSPPFFFSLRETKTMRRFQLH